MFSVCCNILSFHFVGRQSKNDVNTLSKMFSKPANLSAPALAILPDVKSFVKKGATLANVKAISDT